MQRKLPGKGVHTEKINFLGFLSKLYDFRVGSERFQVVSVVAEDRHGWIISCVT